MHPHRVELLDGSRVLIRPIGPEDAAREQAFVRKLSDRSRRLRFFSPIAELSPVMLERFIRPDYPAECALIAIVETGAGEEQIGVARYARPDPSGCAEFAIVIADAWQGRGLGHHLLADLIGAATEAGIKRLEGLVLRENTSMLAFVAEMGFRAERHGDDPTLMKVILVLGR